jgi:hypothetical protein
MNNDWVIKLLALISPGPSSTIEASVHRANSLQPLMP